MEWRVVVWRLNWSGRFGLVEEGMRDRRRISSGASLLVYWKDVDSAISVAIDS